MADLASQIKITEDSIARQNNERRHIIIFVGSRVQLPPGKIFPSLSPEFFVLKVSETKNGWQLILNNGAIIEHGDKVGVVDPLTKNTYEQSKRHLYDHTLIVGEYIYLDTFLSKDENIDVPEGSCLSFICDLYYYFHILSTFLSCYDYIKCDICMKYIYILCNL
jgi:hypothetical protein